MQSKLTVSMGMEWLRSTFIVTIFHLSNFLLDKVKIKSTFLFKSVVNETQGKIEMTLR